MLPVIETQQKADVYAAVRQRSIDICEPLETEDYAVQPCSEVSPPKWHLAHTSWFFEQVILSSYLPDYQPYDKAYSRLFNSYYKSAGMHWLQSERGHLSRPSVKEILAYRKYVDAHMHTLYEQQQQAAIHTLVELGLQHEQQHQELLLMDIKYILANNPSFPVYSTAVLPNSEQPGNIWLEHNEGVFEIGNDANSFAYDNERPKHKCYIYPFKCRNSLVSNGEFIEFIKAGGYQNPSFWLSKGYDFIQSQQVSQPLYWIKTDDGYYEYTLHGLQPLDMNAPVAHVSYFEADAFARWHGHRLPTEAELELATAFSQHTEDDYGTNYHPFDSNRTSGQTWCWTASHYSPYPGFSPFSGITEEYNGKFMCNQFVLRGGCVATPPRHWRNTYRNFYEPHQRWMFSGIRLASDC